MSTSDSGAVASTEGLGPLPPPAGMMPSKLCPSTGGVFGPLYTAEQMRAYATEQMAAERERCAKLVESLTYKSRWISAGINSEPIKECDLAAAIRGA